MDRPSFEEAVRIAKEYRAQAEASRPSRMMLGFLIQLSDESLSAWDDVNAIAQQHLRNGKPLPPMLSLWVADVLAGKERPRQKGRPLKRERHRIIVDIIEKLESVGFHPYRNREAAQRESGCDAAARALDEKYENVEAVWRRYSKWRRRNFTDAEAEWLGFNPPPS